ncbi:protogenin-like [Dendronephthya gigantea]|uniref:protogenin-like n=1 Tax=Dendronephthya gigantea TaxID=151771 RepID=UPI00106CA207|nr:protogenin-like [Dendronephthya gigantea]
MENYIWNLRHIFFLVATIQLPLARTLYKDLSGRCLATIKSKHFKTLIPNISYRATPYPYVTKNTIITLECTGSVKINPLNQGYMTRVEFLKNNNYLHKCEVEKVLRYKILSCSVTVTGVTKDDKFMCVLTASKAPCNAARLSFRVENRLPRPNNIHLAKITSKEAVIRWEKISSKPKINGVLLGYKLILTSRKRKLSFISANDTNHVVFPDLAPKSNYILSIRGFTQYSDGYAVLYNFSSLDLIPAPKNIQVVILSKTSVGIQWFLVQQREEKYDKIFGYRVNVRNATHSFQIDTLSVTYSVVLRHLSPDANYSVSVFGFGNGTKGISSKWIHFKINDRDEKSEDDNTGAKSKDARNFTLTIVVVLIVGIIAGAIFVLIAVYLLTRHERRVAKSQNITAVKFSQNDKAVKFAVNPANNIH